MGCASASDDFSSSSLDDSDNDLSNGVGISSVSSASYDSSNTDSPISLEDIQDKSIVDNDGSFSDNSSELNTLNMPSKYDNSKIGTRINAKKVSAYYKEKANLNISLKDSNNNVLKNKQVKILLNGKTFVKKTDNNGNIRFLLNLNPGNYNVKLIFVGDDTYEKTSFNTKITIKKTPLSIKTKNYSTYYKSDLFFTAKVINSITKYPIDGVKVLFKVYSSKTKYKKYYSLTNRKGIAHLNKNFKVGSYDVYTFLNETNEKKYLEYKNLKNKAVLKVKKTAEMGCSSIYVYVSENESAIAFRRDSTYAAKLYVVAQKWHGRHAVKQYKLTGTYFFHAIVTSDGWMMGTGGWDNPTVNKKIENLAGKIVSTNSMKNSNLKAIKRVESRLPTGHFAIVAPNGRYAVIWKNKIIKGKLKKGEYLDVPNIRSSFRCGKFKKFSTDPATAAHKIAATDHFGVNRRNIMTYHYKRASKNYKTYSTVEVYGSNDKGNLVGRHTSHLKDHVLFKKTFFNKNKLFKTPNKKLLGIHKFGNIDKLIKTNTKVTAPKVTADFNNTNYLKITLKNKKTNKTLKGVKINIKVTSAKKSNNYVIKTNKNGVAQFNTRVLDVGTHNVTITPANHKYIISGKSKIVIKAVKTSPPIKNTTDVNPAPTGNGTNVSNTSGSVMDNGTSEDNGTVEDNSAGGDRDIRLGNYDDVTASDSNDGHPIGLFLPIGFNIMVA